MDCCKTTTLGEKVPRICLFKDEYPLCDYPELQQSCCESESLQIVGFLKFIVHLSCLLIESLSKREGQKGAPGSDAPGACGTQLNHFSQNSACCFSRSAFFLFSAASIHALFSHANVNVSFRMLFRNVSR